MFSQFTEAQNSSCGQTISDLQGISANYLPGEISTDTLYAGVGESLQLTFSLLELADGDTLRIYDTSISDSIAIATFTFGDTATTIQSWGNTLVISFKADSTFESEGWEAYVTCNIQQFANLSLNIDSLCAGIEIIAPFQIIAPLPDSLFVEAFLSDESGSFLNPTPIGEGFTADTTLFIQLAADLPSGNNYKLRLLIQDSGGIQFQQDIPIVISRPPNQPIIIGPDYFCGETISLSAEMQDRTNFTWIYQGDSIPSVIIPQLQTNQAGTYEIIAENFCASVVSASFDLIQIPVPLVPQITSSTQLICNSDTATISLASDADTSIFQWVFNGLELNDSSQTIQTTQPGNYYCIRNNQCGFSISDTITIDALQSPSSETIIALGDLNICVGDSLQLNISNANNQVFWFRDLVPYSQGDSAISVSQSGLYTATLQNVCGETNSSNSLQVDVQTFPLVPQISSSKVLICNSDTASISLVSDGDNSIFQWVRNGVELPESAQSIQTTQPGIYYCIRNNQCGFSISDTITIDALQSPSSETIIASGDLNICVGDSLQLNISNANNQIFWFLDSMPYSQGDSAISVSQSGLYTAILQNACGDASSSNSIQIEVQLFPLPASLNAAGPTTLCEGNSVLLLAEIPAGEQFQWFLNNSPVSSNVDQISASESGVYSIVSSNSCGTTNSSNSVSVTINPLPEVPLLYSFSTPALCNGSSVTLAVQAQQGALYSWKKNGAIFPGNTNSISTNQSGAYTVSVINGCGTVLSENSISVTSGSTPLAPSIGAGGATTFCLGGSVTLNTSPQQGVLYRWIRNGFETVGTNFNLQATQSGSYKVEVSNACDTLISSSTIQLNVIQVPIQVQLNPLGEQSICLGDSLSLSIPTVSGVSYQWKFNNEPLSFNTNSIDVYEEGTYTIVLANTCGQTPANNSVYLNVDSIPPASSGILAQPGTALCPGGYVLLNADQVPYQLYSWYLNGSLLSGQQNPVLQATEWGMYTLQTNNACGISDTSAGITLGPGDPPSNFELYSSADTTFCSNDSLQITAQTTFGVSVRWFLNEVFLVEGPSQIYAHAPGVYSANCWNGCGEAQAINTLNLITISAPEIPIIVFTNGILQTNAIGTLQWLNSTMEEIAGADSASFLPEQTSGTFYVRLTNENGCSEISAPFQYSVVGLDELTKLNFQVYPNPTNDLLFIKSNESTQLQLHDVTGRFIQTISIIENSEKSISLSDLNPGVYLLGHSGFWKRIIVN